MIPEAPACYLCGKPMQYKFEKQGHPIFRCAPCELESIYPQPDDAALAAIYDSSYFDIYGSDQDEGSFRRMKRLSFQGFLRPITPMRPGSRLVDCGAGTGYMVAFARDLGLDAYAIELSDYGAAKCRDIVGGSHLFQGEVQDSRFDANPDNRYETITMIDFIEHVRDPRLVLQWAASHLTPNGNLLVVTPSLGSLSHRIFRLRWPNYYPEHLWYFGPGSLTRLLVECGFTVRQVLPAVKYLSPQYIINRNRSYKYHASIAVPCKIADRLMPLKIKSINIPLRTGDILVHASI